MLWLLLSCVVVGAAGSSCTGEENMCDSAVEKLVVKFGSAQISCNADVTGQQAADKPTVDFPSGTETGSSLVYEKELIDYMGPSPPAGKGPHRYQFILWAWPGSNASSPSVKTDKRPGFKFDEFKKNNNLGKPVAVFQFKTATPK